MTMFYDDVRAGTNLLMLFITFNIHVMNVLAFLKHYGFVIICDFIVTNPVPFQDLTSSNNFVCDI